MTRFIVVRHGESEANKVRIFAGVSDYNLTERGHDQAEMTAEYIARNFKIDAIYSSHLKRAYQTAEHTSNKFGLPITADPELREVDGGKWDGMYFDDLNRLYPEEYHIWRTDIGHCQCPGGDNPTDIQTRAIKALKKIAKENDGKTVAVFTHAMVIRCCEGIWRGVSLNELKDIPWVSNSSITVVEYDEKNGFSLIKRDINEHLEGVQTKFPANC